MGKMTIKYENEDSNANMPDGMGLYTYLGNIKIPLSGGSGGLNDLYYGLAEEYTVEYLGSDDRPTPTYHYYLLLMARTKFGYITICGLESDLFYGRVEYTRSFYGHTFHMTRYGEPTVDGVPYGSGGYGIHNLKSKDKYSYRIWVFAKANNL